MMNVEFTLKWRFFFLGGGGGTIWLASSCKGFTFFIGICIYLVDHFVACTLGNLAEVTGNITQNVYLQKVAQPPWLPPNFFFTVLVF